MPHSIYENETHQELRKLVRDFAEKEIAPVAASLDEKEEFSEVLTLRMGELGLFGINLPEKYTGKAKDTLSYIIAVEELARVDSSQAATLAAHNSLGIYPIYKYGTDRQKEKFLPRLTTGKEVWAFGLTEKMAGSDARGTETQAKLSNGKWIVNGEKQYITNGSVDINAGITLQAITGMKEGKKELSTILIEREREGFTSEKMTGKMMWRSADTARLWFKEVEVPEENLLGERGKGPHIMFDTLDGGRLSIAAIGLGLAEGAFMHALAYAKEREQFGRPIGKNQSIAFKLADMDLKIELARNLLYKACWLKDTGSNFTREAAMAKLYCSEIAREIADGAVQIFGGAGLFKSGPVERYFRDQKLLSIGEGTSEILRMVLSRKLGL